MSAKIQVAVILEFHPYDAVNFQRMLWSFTDCECFVQPLDLFAQDEENRLKYDAALYYNLTLPTPAPESPVRKYFEEVLGSTKQGIVLLHHAVLSLPDWDLWTDVTGIEKRCVPGFFEYHQNETVRSHVTDAAHPVTKGVGDWSMLDETYIISEPYEQGNRVLIQTDNANSIKNIAWTRAYKDSRVFCYASGHDDRAYGNTNFREVLHRGLLWSAGKI
jgi:hypothetical protein